LAVLIEPGRHSIDFFLKVSVGEPAHDCARRNIQCSGEHPEARLDPPRLQLPTDCDRRPSLLMGIRSLLILRVGATQSLANENDEIPRDVEVVVPAQRVQHAGNEPVHQLVGNGEPTSREMSLPSLSEVLGLDQLLHDLERDLADCLVIGIQDGSNHFRIEPVLPQLALHEVKLVHTTYYSDLNFGVRVSTEKLHVVL